MEVLLFLSVVVVALLTAMLVQYTTVQNWTEPARQGLETPVHWRGRDYYVLTSLQYQILYGAYLRELERSVGRRGNL